VDLLADAEEGSRSSIVAFWTAPDTSMLFGSRINFWPRGRANFQMVKRISGMMSRRRKPSLDFDLGVMARGARSSMTEDTEGGLVVSEDGGDE